MSGLLHPQGPEPARTYWIRRGILLAVVLVLIVLIVLGVRGLTKSVVATAPAPTITPPVVSSSTPTTTPIASSGSIAPTPGAGVSTKPTLSPTGTPAATARSTASTKSTISAKARPTATPTPACLPANLRVRLKGDRNLSPGEKNTFTLSMINTSKVTCLASVTDKNLELKIYSGTDRIWSSKDCAKVLTDFDKKLAAGADVIWKMTWNGKRSVKGKSCKVGSPTPLPGTYWATAQLAGAKPVQWAMIIR